MRNEEKLVGCSCKFHGSLWPVWGEGDFFVLADKHFALLFLFVWKNYIAFYIKKNFFFLHCVLYVLKIVRFVFIIQFT